jgi:hypothetical protein
VRWYSSTLYYTKGEALPSKHSYAKKIGAKQYCGFKTQKNSKELFKGNPEYWNLNGQAFYSTNMTWKQRSTIVNFYHKYFATCQQAAKEPFHIHGLHLEHGRDYLRYSTFTPDITNMWILSKMIEDTVVKCKILRDDSLEFRRHTGIGYRFVEEEKIENYSEF